MRVEYVCDASVCMRDNLIRKVRTGGGGRGGCVRVDMVWCKSGGRERGLLVAAGLLLLVK